MPEIVNVEQAAAWDGPSGDAWVAREEVLNAALSAHTDLLFTAAAVAPADRVLDVGCGTGATTRAAARRAIHGRATGVDLSSAMLQRAGERAAAEGLTNVTFEQADAQVHPFASGGVDLLLSRFGVMFFADPVAAFANLARATAAGGRLAAVVWQSFEHNEWVSVPYTALAIDRELPPLPSGGPGPFGLADADRTRRVLRDAGWSSVELTEAAVPYDFGPDVEAAVDHARQIGFLRGVLGSLDDDERARALAALHEAMAARATPDGIALPSQIWVVTAVR